MAQALNEDGVQKLTALKGQLLSKGYQLSDPGLKEILRQGKDLLLRKQQNAEPANDPFNSFLSAFDKMAGAPQLSQGSGKGPGKGPGGSVHGYGGYPPAPLGMTPATSSTGYGGGGPGGFASKGPSGKGEILVAKGQQLLLMGDPAQQAKGQLLIEKGKTLLASATQEANGGSTGAAGATDKKEQQSSGSYRPLLAFHCLIGPIHESISASWVYENLLIPMGTVVSKARRKKLMYVEFSDANSVWKASTCLDGRELMGLRLKVVPSKDTEKRIAAWKEDARELLFQKTKNKPSLAECEWELEKKTHVLQARVAAKLASVGREEGGKSGKEEGEEKDDGIPDGVKQLQARKNRRDAELTKIKSELRAREKVRRGKQAQMDCNDIDAEIRDARREKFVGRDPDHVGDKMQAQEWRNLVRYCVSGISKEEVLRHSFSLDALKRSNVIAKKVLPFLREKLEEIFMGEQPEMAEYVASGLVSLTHPLPPNTSLSTDCMGFIKLLTRFVDEDIAEEMGVRLFRMIMFELRRGAFV